MSRLTVGTRVRTLADAGNDDWSEPRKPQWGAEGVVIHVHDAHGLCYRVRHEDDTVCVYDPEELELVALKPYSEWTKDQLMHLLETLTVGGSEFYQCPENCAQHVRERITTTMQTRRDAARFRNKNRPT